LFSKIRLLIIALLLAGSILLAGFITVSQDDPLFQIRKYFSIFSEVVTEINEAYVVEVDPEDMIRSGIDAMLETLDPYTVLIDESKSRDLDILTTGSYAGVGIEIGARGENLVVITPLEGYPADRNGIRAGDIIVEINGISTENLTPDDLNIELRGEVDSVVELGIRRYGIDELLEFSLQRERIEVNNIEWAGFADDDERIAYILLSRFGQNAGSEVRQALEELQQSAESPFEGVILDLRNNPGGLLSEAVKTSEIFLPPGLEIVSTRDRNQEVQQRFGTDQAALLPDTPVVLLQNQGSASSSEIVSGAMQDYDRAVIMGQTSFGKGLVQIIRPISYGMALKITTSKYYIPSGRYIQSVDYQQDGGADAESAEARAFETRAGRTVYQKNGINPDLMLESREPGLMEVALLQGNHFFDFANRYAAENPEMPLPGQDDETLINAFTDYLEDEDFTFKTEAERLLQSLQEEINTESGDQYADPGLFEELKTQIKEQKQEQMMAQQPLLLRRLYTELAGRYTSDIPRARLRLSTDREVDEAISLLKDKERYQSYLTPESR
jgi:carboxyl-terminal processing protease